MSTRGQTRSEYPTTLVGRGERKQLTVLYYDLVQSLTLANLIGDPEAFLDLERSVHSEIRGALVTPRWHQVPNGG